MHLIRKSSSIPSQEYSLCTIWTWFDWDMGQTLGICYQSCVQKSSNVDDNKELITTFRTVYFIHWLDLNWPRYGSNTGQSIITKKQSWYPFGGQTSKLAVPLHMKEALRTYQKLKRSLETAQIWPSYSSFEVYFRAGLLFLSEHWLYLGQIKVNDW